ncbi:MAG TPA: hypothetical protein VFN13_13795 [Rudaea sp.]|nr:hypothetical protein [Rudaea sp.]
MKRHLHWWITLLFVLCLGYDLVMWGAAARLPDIGPKLQQSAQRQALFAHMYMTAGSALDAAVPWLDDWGTRHIQTALAQGFPRIKDDPRVAMDLIFSENWNSAHATLKLMYWAAPILGVLALVFWSRKPKKLHMMGSR